MTRTKRLSMLPLVASATLVMGNIIFPLSAYSQMEKPPSEPTNLEQSPSSLKPIGGPGGKAFREPIPTDAVQVVTVNVWGGDYVDAIQFIWKDAQGSLIQGKKWGGKKGVPCIQLEVPPGQYIKSIVGRYGDNIDNIVIERSDGYKVSCGGGGGPNRFKHVAPDGDAIWSVFGRAGDYLDAIGVLLQTIPKPVVNR